jgi:hypothetical protein
MSIVRMPPLLSSEKAMARARKRLAVSCSWESWRYSFGKTLSSLTVCFLESKNASSSLKLEYS